MAICSGNIQRDGIDALLEWLQKHDFFSAPASTKYHGNYVGGLCEHSLNVYYELDKLNALYGCAYSDETLAIVALFHDVCKTNFYKPAVRNVKVDGQWTTKEVWEIDDSYPLGHGEKSCIIIQRFMQLTFEELLAIRWHMGAFDNAVKGGDYSISKAQDKSKLLTLLQMADMAASQLVENVSENDKEVTCQKQQKN